jgi:hypothetical protein
MPAPLSTAHRNRLQSVTSEAREEATRICWAALENLAVHEGDYRPHMTVDQRLLRNRLRARGKAMGDAREERSGRQELKRLAEEAAYEHWHRLLFTRFLAENHLLITDAANGSVPVTLEDCEELASELGAKDGFELACRFSSTTLPGVFRTDDPILELAFPANDRKKLRDLLDSIPQDVFTASDSLGWTYQFWQTKRKKEVNESGVKIGADELSPVTQLFTEDYMVDFLLDNTLGAWWAGRLVAVSNSLFQVSSCPTEADARAACALPGQPWKYLRFVRSGELETSNLKLETHWRPAAGTFDGWPKSVAELKCLDPCMGSGHFVVAMFERLMALRMAEERLEEIAAVGAVLRDNLYGLELDPRCTQIAAFNLALAAWRRVGYCLLPPLHLACSGLAPNAKREDWLKLTSDAPELRFQMGALYDLFQKAPVLGSLINPRADKAVSYGDAFSKLQPLLDQALKSEQNRLRESVDTSDYEMTVTAQGVAKAAEILAGQFTLVATNVPYLISRKQDSVLQAFCTSSFPSSKGDLATTFVERGLSLLSESGTQAIVSPQNWLFLGSYEKFRTDLLRCKSFNLIARLGAKGFQTQMWDFNVALFLISANKPNSSHPLVGLTVESAGSPEEKAVGLASTAMSSVLQVGQLKNPGAALTFAAPSFLSPLSRYASAPNGSHGGDSPRHRRPFWEFDSVSKNWRTFQGTFPNSTPFAGREFLFSWFGDGMEHRHNSGARLQGEEVVGKRGVVVSMMGALPVALYLGDLFDISCTPLVPRDPNHLPAIWAYCTSPEYSSEVRKIDQALKVTNATLAKVPFDLAHWQKVAAEKYPDGLPKPFSSDPTQWLFNGHPAGSDQPLHVAVARLLGYEWPRQTGSSFPDCPALGPDGLESLADTDGIVCLPALNREQPAATRLRALLTAALGSYNERDLIQKSGPKGKGSNKTSLEDWLRDDFFSQHCALFHSRPFLWHLWDGEKDGFHALVNYHKLDHANLKKLAYTYLGDWIRDQDAAAKAQTPGAAERLGAAKKLQAKLIAILEGEAPLDLFIRWKPLHQQPIGWNPDLNDGVRLNIRPFLLAGDVGAKGAGLFRAKPGIDPKPKPDRGTEPQRPKADYPWFWCAEDPSTDPEGGKDPTGRRWNTAHFSLERKQAARSKNA